MSKGKYRKCSLRQNVEKKKHVKGKYRKENIEGKGEGEGVSEVG